MAKRGSRKSGGSTGSRGSGGSGITITENTLSAGIASLPELANRICAFVLTKNAPQAENWMKMNAPWKDQTSNARNGLSAEYQGAKGGTHVMGLFHQVPYGIWLEVKNSGEYAIIDPALNEWGPRCMKDLNGLIEKLGQKGN